MAENESVSPSPFPRTPPHIAALACWVLPLAGLFVGSFARRATGNLAWQRLTLPFIGLGILLALYALLSIRRHGREGLLVGGIVGLALNGTLVAIFALIHQTGRM